MEDWKYIGPTDRQRALKAEADLAACREENGRLRAVAHSAKIVYDVCNKEVEQCPHGIKPSYPTHAWWCDDCFGELGDRLEALDD